ncbi:hypothetical protein BD309DRAFT_652936 [Dichomitus squalens]|nr:hypothetical protein BD309DRAFT_652936 [Dichomitus squalens]
MVDTLESRQLNGLLSACSRSWPWSRALLPYSTVWRSMTGRVTATPALAPVENWSLVSGPHSARNSTSRMHVTDLRYKHWDTRIHIANTSNA